MISKTILATNPRHRPLLDILKTGWREAQSGMWVFDGLSVSLEIDGLWHSYAHETDTRKNSPGFMAVSDAMRDAMQRAGVAA